jgi:hypothetical protein
VQSHSYKNIATPLSLSPILPPLPLLSLSSPPLPLHLPHFPLLQAEEERKKEEEKKRKKKEKEKEEEEERKKERQGC